MPKFFNMHDLNILWRESITMVGDRGRASERQEDQGQQTRRRDSRSQSRSRERLERLRREGGMSSDQQENLRRANETLLDRLRPHLFPDTLWSMEGHPAAPPAPAIEPASPHIVNRALNALNETLNMSYTERREFNQ